MKKITRILGIGLLTFGLSLSTAFAQSPEKMSYQAVVRNSSDALVTSTAVGMQISILQGSANGSSVYTETHTPNTNINGLVSLEIGTGTVVSGDFTTIDWANDTYFIKTETDPTGGTTYTITGTSQLMSVPFALHAKTAANGVTPAQASAITANTAKVDQTISRTGTTVTLTNGGTFTDSVNTYTAGTNITISASNVISATSSAGTHYLGEEFNGGVIYHLYIGSDGLQHGLIVAKTESVTTLQWQTTYAVTSGARSWDGVYNTAQAIALASTNPCPAVTYVTSLNNASFNDWYLPSIDELRRLYANRDFANKALSTISGATLLSNTAYYWSSTEVSTALAYGFGFNSGSASSLNKGFTYSVRAVRAF